jgi:ligand-binding sensor domain-containing protein
MVNFNIIKESYFLRLIKVDRMTKKNIFRPVNLFIVAVLMTVVIGMRNAYPLINPANNANHPPTAVSGNPDSLSNGHGLSVKNVFSIIVDKDNIKWFCSDAGIVSYDGQNWKSHDGIRNLPFQDLKGIAYVMNSEGPELWIASPEGATVARLPMDDQNNAFTLSPENSGIFGKEVVSIAAGKNSIRWIGTEKGISALSHDTWLTPAYDMYYPEELFQGWPITTIATNPEGDSLYAGTAGAGIARVYRDEVDAISGASVYAQWGPIILPSDNIYSIYIDPDGIQWFGTDAGIARHTGYNTLENWTVYTTEDGLVDNFVQAICGDGKGNIWIGTSGGVSVFDGSSWKSYTTEDGLASNHILSLAVDHEGTVWIGTDTGIASYENGVFVNK